MARKKQTFDEAMERLEEIVEQLEQEEVSLETAVSLYKEGLTLAAEIVLLRKEAGLWQEEPFQAEVEE